MCTFMRNERVWDVKIAYVNKNGNKQCVLKTCLICQKYL